MDFTREPIIETVVTPKEGCKLVVRSSKTLGQEEYFVDSVEVVSFGHAIFFRSLERPKSFVVPASDYEILEVREAKIVLKNVGLERSIKIGGGREGTVKTPREPVVEVASEKETPQVPAPKAEGRVDRKRDRRRQYRKRKVRDENGVMVEDAQEVVGLEEKVDLSPPEKMDSETEIADAVNRTGMLLANLLSPPPLISETISRYKEEFGDAFYTKEEQEARLANEEDPISVLPSIALEQPAFDAFEMSEEQEEEIFLQRKRHLLFEEEEEGEAPESFSLEEEVKEAPHPESSAKEESESSSP